MKRRLVRALLLVVLPAALASLAWRCQPSWDGPARPPEAIRGFVLNADGPLEGATVRIQATDSVTVSGADGSFALRAGAGTAATVTAWFAGHYIGHAEVTPGGTPVVITLERHYTTDNESYTWFSSENAEGSKSCGHCMPGHYEEWKGDAHALAARNPRFLSMYNGTDVKGNRGPVTRYGQDRDYGRFPLGPDPNRPYYGPGYKLDFPDTAGNCAACHVPGAAASLGRQFQADVNRLDRFEKEGIFCDFCHKVGEITLDPATGLPYWSTPGVLSMRLYRPKEGQQLFFGTFDDVTRRVTYLPLLRESTFCAPCHWGVFWGVLVYNSYGEWLESPYSDPNTGKTCQDCHMPVTKDEWFVRPERGGLRRRPGGIFRHRMPGASDVALLRDTAKVQVRAKRRGDRIVAAVRVTNEKAGHHIPTDHPARNILLVVSAVDAEGRRLEHVGKQVLPPWAGEGKEPDDYAGRPGKGYAKILEELWTETSPTAAYWRQTVLRKDTRIPALATDVTHYEFRAPKGRQRVTVRARLIFRRAFKKLARQKKWPRKDILMEDEKATVP